MKLKLTKSESITLTNAIEYFDDFYANAVPEDENEWEDAEHEIDRINLELDDVYEQVSYSNILEVSLNDLRNVLSALSVYKGMVKYDIANPRNIKRSKAETDLAIANAEALLSRIMNIASNLFPDEPIEFFEIGFEPD